MLESTGNKVYSGWSAVRSLAKHALVDHIAPASMFPGGGDLDAAAASSEQAEGVEQIHAAVGSLDEVVQQTAASSEELAAAAEETSGQVESLRSTVSGFRWESDRESRRPHHGAGTLSASGTSSRTDAAARNPAPNAHAPAEAATTAGGEDDWSDWDESIDAIDAALPEPRRAA
jgi:hypothetical protein